MVYKTLLWLLLSTFPFLAMAEDVAAPEPSVSTSTPSSRYASYDDMVMVALSLIGTPYRYGGTSPEKGFDCSGLVQFVLSVASPIKLPRSSHDMFYSTAGRVIDKTELKPGDLLFFKVGKKKRISHVAVYIGENRFVHAPSTGKVVAVTSMDEKYWQRYYFGAKRVLPENDAPTTAILISPDRSKTIN